MTGIDQKQIHQSGFVFRERVIDHPGNRRQRSHARVAHAHHKSARVDDRLHTRDGVANVRIAWRVRIAVVTAFAYMPAYVPCSVCNAHFQSQAIAFCTPTTGDVYRNRLRKLGFPVHLRRIRYIESFPAPRIVQQVVPDLGLVVAGRTAAKWEVIESARPLHALYQANRASQKISD